LSALRSLQLIEKCRSCKCLSDKQRYASSAWGTTVECWRIRQVYYVHSK